MRVAHRLFLAVLPAVLGVLTVTALAYRCRRQYQVPGSLLGVAVVTATGSLGVAWWNARYLARRIQGLSGRSAPAFGSTADELDAIEHGIGEMDATRGELASEAGRRMDAERRTREYAGLIAATAETVQTRIAEIRLPPHILLENRFGELNENQEEMLTPHGTRRKRPTPSCAASGASWSWTPAISGSVPRASGWRI